ncbi:MAG: ParB/RepB/Spo0J family partition protein [Proteobacteria bacterium]|nr:ParB/RepB/Spo0J family partition protein [Pseudomonadota bacterium]
MSGKRSTLGRNLNALLGTVIVSEKPIAVSEKTEEKTTELKTTHLQPSVYQPRTTMDQSALQELADSIKAQGIIQPIAVRKIDADKYEILAGERRWRAAQLAGLEQVPVIIHNVSDQSAMAIALIENVQREDLNPLEQSQSLQRLIEEFNLTHQQVAEAVGKSRTTVTNLLRLSSLPVEIKQFIHEKKMEMGHARALLLLEPEVQKQLAKLIIEKNWSVRETERQVQKLQKPTTETVKAKQRIPAEIVQYQNVLNQQFSNHLVNIDHRRSGHGKVVIHYRNKQELSEIISKVEK